MENAINQLNDVVNSTWGKSSGDGTRSVTCDVQGDELLIKFQTVVHFASEQALRQQVDRLVDESMQVIAGKVDHTKASYKEASGATLKLDEVSNTDSIEMVSASNLNPRKIAIYRRTCVLRVQ